MLKAKIIAELRKKYPGMRPSVLALFAEKLETTVTEESQIEGAINGLEDGLIKPSEFNKIVQSDGDKRVNDALQKKTDPKPTDPKPEDPKPDDNDPLAKVLNEISKLNNKISDLEKKDSQKSVQEQLHAKLKEKKIPLQLAKGVNLESADELDSAFEGIEKEWADMQKTLQDQGLMGTLPRPGGGVQNIIETSDDKAVKSDIEAWAKKGEKKTA